MRIRLIVSPPNRIISWDYQHDLTRWLHQRLGENDIHDGTSLYSTGYLGRGKSIGDEGLAFPTGTTWELSFHDSQIGHRLTDNIDADPNFIYGMRILNVERLMTPRFAPTFRFRAASPILVREKREDGTQDHLLWNEPKADELLTKVFRYKMSLAGLSEADQQSWIGFDRSYTKAHEKLVTIKGIQLKTSICPVIVNGTPDAVRFCWNVGAGHLTGSCLGPLNAD